MKKLTYILGLCFFLCFAFPEVGRAQEILWNADFDFRFDNREYGEPSNMVAPSTTLFGANMSPELGLGWGYGHSLMVGATIPADRESENFMGEPEFVAYYAYEGKTFSTALGLLPRKKLFGRYSYAFFSDTYRFYNPTIKGWLVQYDKPDWFVEFGGDWNGLYSPTGRDNFTLFVAGESHKSITYAGYTALLHHLFSEANVTNSLSDIYVGLDFSELLRNAKLSVQVAWVNGYQSRRGEVSSVVTTKGFEAEINARYTDYGLRNTFYKGDNLMPLWDMPNGVGGNLGESLYFGDPFYRVGDKGFYNRLELFWEPKMSEGVSLRISSVHHYDGVHWGWQQTVALSLSIGSDMFAPIR